MMFTAPRCSQSLQFKTSASGIDVHNKAIFWWACWLLGWLLGWLDPGVDLAGDPGGLPYIDGLLNFMKIYENPLKNQLFDLISMNFMKMYENPWKSLFFKLIFMNFMKMYENYEKIYFLS